MYCFHLFLHCWTVLMTLLKSVLMSFTVLFIYRVGFDVWLHCYLIVINYLDQCGKDHRTLFWDFAVSNLYLEKLILFLSKGSSDAHMKNTPESWEHWCQLAAVSLHSLSCVLSLSPDMCASKFISLHFCECFYYRSEIDTHPCALKGEKNQTQKQGRR